MKRHLLKPLRWKSGESYHDMLRKLGEDRCQAWLGRNCLDRQGVGEAIEYCLSRPNKED